MSKLNAPLTTSTPSAQPVHGAARAETANGQPGRNRRNEPNPLGGNFILMPSLLEYLSPDLTLPEQYFGRQRNDDGMGAERALMYAVLKDGIRCFYKHVGATRRKYRKMSAEAEEWLMDDTWDYPFSFRVICDTLSIDADCLRQRLVDWKEAELDRRRVTGDTKTVQVGRSPFPTPLTELDEFRATSLHDDEDNDDEFVEDDFHGVGCASSKAPAGREAHADEELVEVEYSYVDLDEVRFAELEQVA